MKGILMIVVLLTSFKYYVMYFTVYTYQNGCIQLQILNKGTTGDKMI